ncbi:MAG: DUF2169 domain-containing protein [Polyangiaceae bacterium]
MSLVSLSPFPAELLPWEADAGQTSLTVVVKATLRLVAGGEATIAPEQLPIDGDQPWDDTPTASLHSASDRAPLKTRTDIVVVGHARSPGGKPTQELVAQVKVGDFQKAITVTATRLWTRGAGGYVPGPPVPFTEMPLRYELAALSADNPVGIDPAAPPVEGAPAFPNLAPVAPATFASFAPLPASWRPRRQLLGEAGRFWALAFETGGSSPEPAPPGLDFRYFNAAPPDQQPAMLRQKADVELVHLHAKHPTFRTRLPPLRPQVFRVDPRTRRPVEIALRCDTLWIDADRELACLVWRGLTDLPSGMPDAIGTVVVVADPQGRRVRWEQVERSMREGVPIEATEPGAADALAMRHDKVRTADAPPKTEPLGERERDETRAFDAGTSGAHRAALPFDGGSSGAHPAPRAPTFDAAASGAHHALPFDAAASGAHHALPFDAAASGAHHALPFDAAASGAPHALPFERPSSPRAAAPPPARTPPAKTPPPARTPSSATTPPPAMSSSPATMPPQAGTAGTSGDLGDDEITHTGDGEDTHDREPDALPAALPAALPFTASGGHPAAVLPSAAEHAAPRKDVPPGDTAPHRAVSKPAPAPTAGEVPPPLPGALPPKPAMLAYPPAPAPAAPAPGVAPAPPPAPPAFCRHRRPAPARPEPAANAEAKVLISPAVAAGLPPAKPAVARPPDASKIDPKAKPAAAEPLPPGFDPTSVPIATYGSISAELMIRRGERPKVLDEHRLSEPVWARVHGHWTGEMGRETARGESRLLAQFDEAYVETMGRLRKPIGVIEYAGILVAIERGAVDKQLASLSLTLSDLMRVQRVWTRRCADDPELGKVLGRAVEEARSKDP